MAEKHRVEYIDLIKGIAIILVVAGHCSLPLPEHMRNMLQHARMPLFVFLSGLFFSTCGDSFKRLLVKKLSKLLVPYVTFRLLFMLMLPFTNEYFNLGMLKSIVYNFIHEGDLYQYNHPLWFLKMLFWQPLLAYCVELGLRKLPKAARLGVTIAVSLAAYGCNRYFWSICPENVSPDMVFFIYKICLMPALILLPLYYAAYTYRDMILCPHKPLHMWLILPVAVAVWYFATECPTWYYGCFFTDSCLRLWMAQLGGIFVAYFIGYMLQRVPYVSYVGRYSLVVLATHVIVIDFAMNMLHIHNVYALFAIVLATAPALIWLLTRFMPHFTAQKDIFRVDENGKMKISFTD